MAMDLLFVDNMVLSWLTQPEPVAGEEDRWRRANNVPKVAEENGELLAVAAPALAEYLTIYELKDHVTVIKQLGRSFQIYPFDSRAASVAAILRQEAGAKDLAWKEAREKSGVSAQEIKSDILILATAIAAGGSAIVTYDAGIQALAEHPHVIRMGFEIRSLPSVQNDLFDSAHDE